MNEYDTKISCRYFFKTHDMLGACVTASGPDPNKPCIFPFKYQDQLHDECILQDDNKYWCMTETANSSDVASKYGYCDLHCPLKNGKNVLLYISYNQWFQKDLF